MTFRNIFIFIITIMVISCVFSEKKETKEEESMRIKKEVFAVMVASNHSATKLKNMTAADNTTIISKTFPVKIEHESEVITVTLCGNVDIGNGVEPYLFTEAINENAYTDVDSIVNSGSLVVGKVTAVSNKCEGRSSVMPTL
ncbi:MAG: hypothetical protein NT086_08490 [Proteobacteria bacterium]|nr:hypothetical protein [Pseudomonadota bacterium]